MADFCTQLRLMLWRNALVKRRARRELLMELLFPFIFFGLLLTLKSSSQPIDRPGNFAPPVYSARDYPPAFYMRARGDLLYAPASDARVQRIVGVVAGTAAQGGGAVRGVADDAAIEREALAPDARVWAALSFHNASDGGVQYAVRLPKSEVPDPSLGQLGLLWQSDSSAMQYFQSGFFSLQAATDDAILRTGGGARAPSNNASLSAAALQTLVYPPYKFDPFHTVLNNIGGLYFVIGFFPVVTSLASFLVQEKETRTKEGLKMMGLRGSAFMLGWYLTSAALTFLPVLVLPALAVVAAFFDHVGFLALFLVLLLYVQCLILLAFVISAFFSRARTASQASGLLTFFLFLPNYLVRASTPRAVVALLSLSPQVAFGRGFAAISDAEAAGVSLGHGNWHGGPATVLPFWTALLILLIDAVLLLVLAWYLDNVVPSEFGTPKPWWFCCSPRFWRHGEVASDIPLFEIYRQRAAEPDPEQPQAARQRDVASAEPVPRQLEDRLRVRVSGLVKVFPKRRDAGPAAATTSKWRLGLGGGGGGGGDARGGDGGAGGEGGAKRKIGDEVEVALAGVDLEMYEGQVFALLGRNGAGKSTAISILTGLLRPTAGEVSVFGRDLFSNMDAVRRDMGVCPQHDVLTARLTVYEQLKLVGALKGMREPRLHAAIEERLRELGLADKTHAPVETLSGGQKRKLSLAIALIGDSRLVFLDEPTSGVDAVSRRLMWDVIARAKRGRVLVLTTHFMDEADLLGDRIAILSRGRVRCVGTSLFLKSRFGIGYHLTLNLADPARADNARLLADLQQHVRGAKWLRAAGSEVAFALPSSESAGFPALLERLETEGAAKHGVRDFGLSVTTLEEVFLRIGEEEDAEIAAENDAVAAGSAPAPAAVPAAAAASTPAADASAAPSAELGANDDEKQPLTGSVRVMSDSDEELTLLPNDARRVASLWEQLRAVWYKRWLSARRNRIGLFFSLVFPLLYVLMVLVIVRGVGSSSAKAPAAVDVSRVAAFASGSPLPFLADNASASATLLSAFPMQSVLLQGGAQALQDYLLHSSAFPPHGDVFVSAAVTTAGAGLSVVLGVNQSAPSLVPSALRLWNEGVRRLLNLSLVVTTLNHPLPERDGSQHVAPDSILVGLLVGIAFSAIPVTFAITLVVERQSRAKQQQLVMGLRLGAFWLGDAAFNVAQYLIPVAVTFVLFAAFGNQVILGPRFGAALLLFVSYGVSAVALASLLQLAFATRTAATTAVNLFFSLGGVILFFAGFAAQFLADAGARTFVLSFLAVFPSFGLQWGLFVLNQMQAGFCVNLCSLDANAAALQNTGRYSLVMLVSAAFYMALVLLIDSGRLRRLLSRGAAEVPPRAEGEGAPEDEDVAAERRRVEQLDAQGTHDNVALVRLTKVFPATSSAAAPKVAVRELSLGIPAGECFGLLGPNGAGKTTVMSVLTGSEAPTAGAAFVSGLSLDLDDKTPIFATLGYCPQFDGLLELLSVREHLVMYGMIRGIREPLLGRCVDHYIRRLGLAPHAYKLSESLSGGNKRRLGLAVALMGNPRLLLLDEVSTGVDVMARRAMWSVLSAEMKLRSVVLTTHSMEEAEALCTRIGIMVNGELRCVGSAQRLKSRFGRGYQLELQTDDAPEASQRLRAFVAQRLSAEARVLEDFGGKLRFSVPHVDYPLSRIFRIIEDARQELHVRDYSLSQATLEQIFIAFARDQRDPAQ